MSRRSALAHFLHAESTGGLALLVATVVALVWANSPLSEAYADLWHTGLTLGVGEVARTEDLRHWVNDGLMTLFFLVVGLEIKRELVVGELRDRKTVALPAMAALGGMVVPALIYVAINLGDGGEPRGWAVPMATDIAFCVGVMAVLGSRVSSSVKLFLLTLAIVDDIGAILVIALFYGGDISIGPLLLSLALLAAFGAMHRFTVPGWPAYAVVGIAAWAALLASGIHATLAGVALGLLTRTDGRSGRESPVERAERVLHPWSSLLVVPVFALANAGLALSAGGLRGAISSPVAVGVALGLVVGKLVGVLGATWVGSRLGIGALPTGVRWGEIAGVASLAGVGFTVSLFVTGLAFDDAVAEQDATLGILAGSLVAAVVGSAILWRMARVEPGEV
ncbi:MAG TPA: Na+/H+ antiporter NhaA [Mycobacteriales bacterium]|nr:Na+/H+ antiporter NhaA [Mycobacteriales bacterium]